MLARHARRLIPRTIPSWIVPRASVPCQLIVERRWSSPATARDMPPNLRFDSRSSFAPVEYEDDEGEIEGDTTVAEETRNDTVEESHQEEEDLLENVQEPKLVVPLPERLHVNIYELTNSSDEIGTIWLSPQVFGCDPIRVDLLKRTVDYYRNKLRGRRKAKTKTIAEVSGSGRKVRPQKGQGRARAGHSRPAHWRGGAKAHGPKNETDYGKTKLNKKVRKMAIRHAFSQKLKEGNLTVVKDFQLESHKTKNFVSIMTENWDIGGRYGTTALLLDQCDKELDSSVGGLPVNLVVASGNEAKVKVAHQDYASVYDLLKYDKLVISLDALQGIEARCGE